jgi:hypothetical protein
MRSFWANPANPSHSSQIHPAVIRLADEFCGTLAYLFVYVGALALLASFSLHLWNQLPSLEADVPAGKPGWSVASRSYPAFAVSQIDFPEKTASYEILRHPEGGRKDILRWAVQDEKPAAELEIYRLGSEFDPSQSPDAELAARMDLKGTHELETAGIIDSKFGKVALLRRAGKADARSCLGYIKRINEPDLQISGWSCQGDGLPARRAAISCVLDRLTLLTAGNDPKLAELFAHAELRRGSCATSAPSADWMTSAENPLLRGRL